MLLGQEGWRHTVVLYDDKMGECVKPFVCQELFQGQHIVAYVVGMMAAALPLAAGTHRARRALAPRPTYRNPQSVNIGFVSAKAQGSDRTHSVVLNPVPYRDPG